MSALPILYSYRRCPYAMRARMALVYAGVQVAIREIDLRNKPEHMLSISPKGTVPVLQLPDSRVLEESLDIMQWALTQSDPDNWLKASDQAKIDRLITENDTDFKQHLNWYKYPERAPDIDQETHRKNGEQFLSTLEKLLSEHHYLIADTVSMVDIAIFPFVRQFAKVDSDWFEKSPYPHLRAWLASLTKSERFDIAMKKYPEWHPDAPVCLFPEVSV